MDALLWIAIILAIIWVIAAFTKFIVGTLLWIILIVAIILFVVWLFKKIF
ncbi:MAG TPA: hypothetical protein VFL93_11915 [Longimicrobiaceae bacterium]|nr:hypothetical protein [Longimicrobiaceae bacterium]